MKSNTINWSELADYQWLTSDEGRALVDEVENDLTTGRRSVPNMIEGLHKRLSPTRSRLIIELLELRPRAEAKFADARQMFFTRRALQQTTDERVAACKATRFAGVDRVADLCCGIGGDLLALVRVASAVGVDCDPIAAHLAAVNTGAMVHCTDAALFDLDAVGAWHIDPDRRPGGRRTTSLECCQPGLAAIDRLLAHAPHAAIKLAPATQVPPHWAERCELEWIGRARQCRQLVAWHGALACAAGQHRATVVPTACSQPHRTLTGRPNQSIPVVDHPDRYVFDVDPAVSAARLTGALATEHDLAALARGNAYLTGPRPIADAALSCFEVEDILPMNLRKLSRHLRDRHIGTLEIKKRGVDVAPEQLRDQLKLRGDRSATLLVTRIGTHHAAILARRFVNSTTLHERPHAC